MVPDIFKMITMRLECEAHIHEEKKFDEATYENIILSEFEIISSKTVVCKHNHENIEIVKNLRMNV